MGGPGAAVGAAGGSPGTAVCALLTEQCQGGGDATPTTEPGEDAFCLQRTFPELSQDE